jgi:hypothetical protein
MGRHAKPGPPESPQVAQVRGALSVFAVRVLCALAAALAAWLATVVQGLTDKTADVRDNLERAVPGITEQLGQLGRDVAGIVPPSVTVEAPAVLGGTSAPAGPVAPGSGAGTTPIRVQVTNTAPRAATSSPSTRPPSSTSSAPSSGAGRAPDPAAPAPVPCPYPPPLDVLLCPPAATRVTWSRVTSPGRWRLSSTHAACRSHDQETTASPSRS